jgi:SAM-dependent methyltransferase
MSSQTQRTRRYFDRHTRSCDRAYARPRPLRSGPARGRDVAAAVVASCPGARVLDAGCGPGRVGAAVLDAGASAYVGIDVSPAMLALARARLGADPRVQLLEADVLSSQLDGEFDVVLALGLFDYLSEPGTAFAWMRAHCSSTLVASFTRSDLVKSPSRRLWYRLHGCRVFDYDEDQVARLLHAAGFPDAGVVQRGPRGFLVCAR